MEQHVANALAQVLECLRAAADGRDGHRILVDALALQLPDARVSLWLQRGRSRPFVRDAMHPPLERDAAQHHQLDVEEFPWRIDLARGRCRVLRPGVAGHDDPALREALQIEGATDVLMIPFVHGSKLELLAVCTLTDGTFSDDVIRTWERVAPHVALVFSNWRLEDATAAARAYRHQFAALAADVVKADDVETTAVRLCELTRVLFGTTRSAFFLLEDRDLVPLAAAGPYGDRAAGGTLHVPPGVEPIFDEALRTRQVIVVNDFRASPYAATPIPLPFRPQAALVIPVADSTGALGVLTASDLDEPRRFGPDAAEEARLLGAVTTVAIRRMLLLEELRRAGQAKDEFLAAVSHELRTPLNVVLGYVQLLTENAFGVLTTEQADTIRRVEMGARSQLALVNDLLDLAEIERGAIHCEFVPLRVSDLAAELSATIQALISTRPISISVEIPDHLFVLTDRERLKQVLVNLLANAAKFTVQGKIQVLAAAGADGVSIEVTDTGSGMEPGFVQRATEPFVRGESGGAGSGLGLAIVSRVLRVLGGSLAIDSRPGWGTTVRILLPSMEHDGMQPPVGS